MGIAKGHSKFKKKKKKKGAMTSPAPDSKLCALSPERQTDRQTYREVTKRQRQRDTETERDRDRVRETGDRDRDRELCQIGKISYKSHAASRYGNNIFTFMNSKLNCI